MTSAPGLYDQARSGTFRMDPEAARKCAATYLRFADSLAPQIHHSTTTHALSGFGGFDSAHQLRTGFERKGHHLTATLTALQRAALDLAAAHLLAAGLIEATDDSTSRLILSAATQDSPS
ncbi:hypothetical protein [Nocardia inohanensis]|uniref:hypothetical protein n=1 Tax=Nocardia inohanensis TaxID=209246 RepID=UPI0008301942|nr:hypothetical protein [Nocardia inohanensis]